MLNHICSLFIKKNLLFIYFFKEKKLLIRSYVKLYSTVEVIMGFQTNYKMCRQYNDIA